MFYKKVSTESLALDRVTAGGRSFQDSLLEKSTEHLYLNVFSMNVLELHWATYSQFLLLYIRDLPPFLLHLPFFFLSTSADRSLMLKYPSKVLHKIFNKSLLEKRSPLFSPVCCSVFGLKLCVATSLHKWSMRTHAHTDECTHAHIHTQTACDFHAALRGHTNVSKYIYNRCCILFFMIKTHFRKFTS